MQVWADFLDLLREKGEVVDFQTAQQQIEGALEMNPLANLQAATTQDLLDTLINRGLTNDQLQLSIIK